MSSTRSLPAPPVGALGPSRAADAVLREDPVLREDLAELTLARLRAARVADADTRRRLHDVVVVSHLWLADSVARRFRDRGEDFDDLRQIARSGLIEACARFDPDQGSFAGFAFPTMVGLVKRHFRDHGWSVRPSRPTQELSAEMWRRWPDIAQVVGGEPTDRQIAGELGVPLDAVRRAKCATQAYTCSPLDTLAAEHEPEDADSGRSDAHLLVTSAWKELTGTEQRLLTMRFFEERSQAEIADELGTNQMQVSRMLNRLLSRLRVVIGSLDEPGSATRVPARAPARTPTSTPTRAGAGLAAQQLDLRAPSRAA